MIALMSVLFLGADPTPVERARAAIEVASGAIGAQSLSVDDAKEISKKTGQKIMIFVGEPAGLPSVDPDDYVFAFAEKYTKDGKNANEKRVVILENRGGKFYIVGTYKQSDFIKGADGDKVTWEGKR